MHRTTGQLHLQNKRKEQAELQDEPDHHALELQWRGGLFFFISIHIIFILMDQDN